VEVGAREKEGKGKMRKIVSILGAVSALLLGAVSAVSAGTYFVPEGLTLLNGMLYQLEPVMEQVGVYLGRTYTDVIETGLFVGGGY